MNERIDAIIDQMDQSGLPYQADDYSMTVTGRDLEYFAELIVRECATVGERYADGNYEVRNQILEHFGLEE
jgi:hypothetical protein